ncbi:MAG: dihydrolipoamide acetyltransferase family protein [Oligoflexia bacterium]|nr:dihydrolipoamide acetyltransferase family protein [Oligoflexia bacterium]
MALKKITLPDLGEGVTEGEILKIKVKEGDSIAMDQALLEVMTDKASMEVPSFIEGVIEKVNVNEGDIISVGAELFTVQTKESPIENKKEFSSKQAEESTDSSCPPPKEKSEKRKAEKADVPPEKFFPLAIPSSRKLAEELGLDLTEVKGSGERGEIKREDLLNYIKKKMKAPSYSTPSFSDFAESKRIPLKGIQRLMFESMTLSRATIPPFTIVEQAQAGHLVKLRTEMKSRLEKQGLKMGYLPFFMKALVPVLKQFPIFNSVYDTKTKEIVFKKHINFGFAVDSPNGLLVPVLKQAENKNLLEIVKELFELSKKTRAGAIEREHLKGAGLTLTNLGSLGGLYGVPIIQAPEMAILGIYKIFKQAVKNEKGEFEETDFINFSITCDHRFIDGATAVRFLKSFVQKIEEPSLLLLEE